MTGREVEAELRIAVDLGGRRSFRVSPIGITAQQGPCRLNQAVPVTNTAIRDDALGVSVRSCCYRNSIAV